MPLALILGTVIVYLQILVNGLKNQYTLTSSFHMPVFVIYFIFIAGLVVFAIIAFKNVPDETL